MGQCDVQDSLNLDVELNNNSRFQMIDGMWMFLSKFEESHLK